MSYIPKIMIVGGGVAGLHVATKLGRSMGSKGTAQIGLIDPNFSHVWKPMLHTFAAGTKDPYLQRLDYLGHARRNHFAYWPGTLKEIDRESRQITLESRKHTDGSVTEGAIFPYDYLIVAVGSQANTFDTPGVKEHCYFIDNLQQANAFQEELRSKVIDLAATKGKFTVAIVGAGSTGTEFAAQLKQYSDLLNNYCTPDVTPTLEVKLIDSGSRVVNVLPELASHQIAAKLAEIGVVVTSNAHVASVDQAGFVLADGSRIDADIKVWAAGVKPPAVIHELKDLELSHGGQLVVTHSLQATRDERVFAIGDCSSYSVDSSSRPLAPTAQVAREQALFLIRHLPAFLKSGKPLPRFQFRDLGTILWLGKYSAYETFGQARLFKNRFFGGRLAEINHSLLYLMHLTDLHGYSGGTVLWIFGILESKLRPSVNIG